jgi:hypothetical protein
MKSRNPDYDAPSYAITVTHSMLKLMLEILHADNQPLDCLNKIKLRDLAKRASVELDNWKKRNGLGG